MRTTSKKWSRLAWQALRVLPLGLLGFACVGQLSEPAVGGESSFLRACAGQCGDGLECISSVCTLGCLLAKDTCGKIDERATCTNASIETGNVAVCDITCTRDTDCKPLGSGFRCEGGFCRGAKLGTGNAQGGGTGTTLIGGASSAGGANGVGGVGGSMPTTIGTPTAGSCRVAYQEYASGTTGIPIADGSSCGTCTCTDGKVECVKLDDCPLGTPVVPCTDLKTDAVDERLPFIAGDSLSLTVGHSGGCATHDYALCYEQGIGASVPEYVWLHLIHDGHGDGCEAYVSKPLTFDLRPLAQHLTQNFSPIHLVNTPYGLYVFGEAATCEERTQAARNQILTSFDAVTKACNTDADCAVFTQSSSCYPSCGTVVSTLTPIDPYSGITSTQLSARLTAVDVGQCSRMQELQCPIPMVDCARTVAACVNNQCVNTAL
ncbi:MAG TPA: hypothetical protein VKP30_26810 [Polyangiaceae bacterium]|nr:hypothetical protein [Polyangiaceae bacterium]